MTTSAIVLYPNDADATFDMSYYLSQHMPLVAETWGPYGLVSWNVVEFATGPDGVKPQYSVQATLVWEKQEQIGIAIEKEGKKVFGDVSNFSNKQPVFLAGEIKAEGEGKK